MPARPGFIRTGGYQKVQTAQPDIVDTAVAAGDFNTLVKAVQAAGLVETLKGDGPYTVFAPTDEAFAKLPPGTIEALLNDKDKLTKVLTYHVVRGKLDAKAFRRTMLSLGKNLNNGASSCGLVLPVVWRACSPHALPLCSGIVRACVARVYKVCLPCRGWRT